MASGPQLLAAHGDRDTAHRTLEKILAEHPDAECRENPNSEQPYEVWSGPDVRETLPEAPADPGPLQEVTIRFSEEELDSIAERVAARMKAPGRKRRGSS